MGAVVGLLCPTGSGWRGGGANVAKKCGMPELQCAVRRVRPRLTQGPVLPAVRGVATTTEQLLCIILFVGVVF